MNIRILHTLNYDGCLNMAIDESILLNGIPTLRFYTWRRPCVSLGYFQKAEELDLEYIRSQDIDLVRRLTGGKAVYHWEELTYSLIVPESFFPPPVRNSYREIGKALLAGLLLLGVKACTVEAPERVSAAADCFQSAAWFEIGVQGRKLIGSAQVRKQGMLLQQGSLLLSLAPQTAGRCFRTPAPDTDTNSRATALDKVIAVSDFPDIHLIIDCMERGFRDTLAADWYYAEISQNEEKLAGELATGKYGSHSWNFRC